MILVPALFVSQFRDFFKLSTGTTEFRIIPIIMKNVPIPILRIATIVLVTRWISTWATKQKRR
jgi:hypothetical protein